MHKSGIKQSFRSIKNQIAKQKYNKIIVDIQLLHFVTNNKGIITANPTIFKAFNKKDTN